MTMTTAQRRATKRYRERGRKSGLKRLEVQVPAAEVDVIRKAAAILREHAEEAASLRTHLGLGTGAAEPANALELFAMAELTSKEADALWDKTMAEVESDRQNPALNRVRDVDL
jgi:hypothetical protein